MTCTAALALQRRFLSPLPILVPPLLILVRHENRATPGTKNTREARTRHHKDSLHRGVSKIARSRSCTLDRMM